MKRVARWLTTAVWAICCVSGQSWAAPQDEPCQQNQLLERWLVNQIPHWQRFLMPISGYEQPGTIEICMAKTGNPRADYAANRIWLSHLDYQEDRLSLAHEFLHLAFKHSPRAHDEVFIETTARQLIQGGTDVL